MTLFRLFTGFLKVGCFAFGGAYSAIPLIRDVVFSYGWMDEETLAHMIAVSESTPGPIMVNLATYVGSRQAGLLGSVLATLAVVLPSFFIILLVMGMMKSVMKNKYVQAALRGIKPCMIGVILSTGVYMMLNNCFPIAQDTSPDLRALLVTALLLGSMPVYRKITKKKLSPIPLIILSAVLGVMIY